MTDSLPDKHGSARPLLLGGLAALAWLGLFLLFGPEWSDTRIARNALLLMVPLAGIGIAVSLAVTLQHLRQEAARLRADLNRLARAEPATDAAKVQEPTGFASPVAEYVPPPAQPTLPLDSGDGMPIDLIDLVRALHFPETPDDTEGFRSLKRALSDHKAGQVVRASQDMLTLLSKDGIYVDDLAPDRAAPDVWRHFAQGAKGSDMGAIGGIHDAEALDICAVRLREDTVFRDTAHHFLRRFDQMLSLVEPDADDTALEAIAETRSARAFMLVGRAAGMFGDQNPNPA